MSVLAAAAVDPAPVAPPPVVPYGIYGGGGARKRKDVVHIQDEDQGGEGGSRHGLFVLETVEEDDREAEAEREQSSIGVVTDEEEEGDEADSKDNEAMKNGGLASLDALDDALPVK
jgi:hypothetical protein